MLEQKLLSPTEIARKVNEIIEEVLATGDWENSIFLKAEAAKLRKLSAEAVKLSHHGEQGQNNNEVVDKSSKRRAVPSGYTQVFILLYQVNAGDLQGWYRTVKTLTEYSVTRPAYKDEHYAQEFIRSKTSGIDRNGYAVVNVKNEDFYDVETSPVDAHGHNLFVLKESSIRLENIVEFVHANKAHYAMGDSELVLLNEDSK